MNEQLAFDGDLLSTAAPQGARLSRCLESFVAVALAVTGLVISVYLTIAHYEQLPLACSTTGIIDCSSVTHSSYSEVAGVPVTLLGLVWFAAMSTMAWRTTPADASTRWLLAQMMAAGGGLLFVVYLVYAELVRLHRICEWCTAIHLLTVTVFLLTIIRLQRGLPVEDEQPLLA